MQKQHPLHEHVYVVGRQAVVLTQFGFTPNFNFHPAWQHHI